MRWIWNRDRGLVPSDLLCKHIKRASHPILFCHLVSHHFIIHLTSKIRSTGLSHTRFPQSATCAVCWLISIPHDLITNHPDITRSRNCTYLPASLKSQTRLQVSLEISLRKYRIRTQSCIHRQTDRSAFVHIGDIKGAEIIRRYVGRRRTHVQVQCLDELWWVLGCGY